LSRLGLPEGDLGVVLSIASPCRRRAASARSAFSLVALLLAGCGSGRVVLPIVVDPSTPTLAGTARSLGSPGESIEDRSVPARGSEFIGRGPTYEAAIQRIASVLVAELRLPVPRGFTVYVYANQAEFEYGLMMDARLGPRRAAELAEFAIGVGKPGELLINDGAVDGHGREWIRLVAHELAHLSQFELARGEGRGEQWLAEGMAEWTAFTVLERLGLDTVARRRSVALASIRNTGLAAARLDLEGMGTPRGFMSRHLREGSLPTYRLAFLMADYLINREGLPRVIDYFHSFSLRLARRRNFERAFGEPLGAFERDVQEYLAELLR
jgi:hypothetical protein